jgi:hypothetical protein
MRFKEECGGGEEARAACMRLFAVGCFGTSKLLKNKKAKEKKKKNWKKRGARGGIRICGCLALAVCERERERARARERERERERSVSLA